MTAYADDVQTMTASALEEEMEAIAKSWRDTPHLAHHTGNNARYNEVREALKKRFNISLEIHASTGTDYWIR